MTDVMITGICSLSGAAIGAVGVILSNFITGKKESKKYEMVNLCEQVIAYWNLERLYSEKYAELINGKAKTVLEDFRDKIETQGYERPYMTENNVNALKRKYKI